MQEGQECFLVVLKGFDTLGVYGSGAHPRGGCLLGRYEDLRAPERRGWFKPQLLPGFCAGYAEEAQQVVEKRRPVPSPGQMSATLQVLQREVLEPVRPLL